MATVPIGDAMDSEVQLLRSTAVVRQASQIPDLEDGTSEHGLTERLNDSLDVEADREHGTIDVSVKWPNGTDAAALANAVVRSYLIHRPGFLPATTPSATFSTGTSRPATISPAGAQARVASCQKALDVFLKTNPEFFAADPDQAVGWQLVKVNDALTSAELEAASAKADYEAVMPILGDPAKLRDLVRAYRPKGLYGPLDRETDQIDAEAEPLEKQRVKESQVVAMRNPLMLALESKIDALRAREDEIEEKKTAILTAYLEHQAAATGIKVAELRKLVEEKRQAASLHVDKSAKHSRLVEDLRQAKERPPETSAEIIQAEPQNEDPSTSSGVTVRVLRRAERPIRPIWQVPIICAGLLAGLIAGLPIGFVLVRRRPADHGTPTNVGLVPEHSDG